MADYCRLLVSISIEAQVLHVAHDLKDPDSPKSFCISVILTFSLRDSTTSLKSVKHDI